MFVFVFVYFLCFEIDVNIFFFQEKAYYFKKAPLFTFLKLSENVENPVKNDGLQCCWKDLAVGFVLSSFNRLNGRKWGP